MVQAFLKKWCVESDFKAPNLPFSLRFKVSGCHYNSIYNSIYLRGKYKKANIHSSIIMFLPALVLYEQSNCIDRIHICYMRSLTKILFFCYLICDERRREKVKVYSRTEHHWKQFSRRSFQLFSDDLTINLDFLTFHDKHNTRTVSVK